MCIRDRTNATTVQRDVAPIELGKAEVLSWGSDGNILACGIMLEEAVSAAKSLNSIGLSVGVINARFIKPIDEQVIRKGIETGFLITAEENNCDGGFGSAVLEAANRMQLPTQRIRVLAIPDQFTEHGDRSELLAEMLLDAAGMHKVAVELHQNQSTVASA